MSGPSMFTYASFTRGGNGHTGGWSVGERVGDLTDAELRSLIERVPTRLDTDNPVPKYASAEEIAALPRRIAWSLAPWGTDHVLWASAPAGEDATGRAGNVFSQVWVFRASGMPSPVNPAGFLDSPSLTFPFGSMEVNATLDRPSPRHPPAPGPSADAGEVWDRLQGVEDIDLQAILLGILDGIDSGRPVILAGERHRAELLIAAVCAVTTPVAAADLTWSTRERARGPARSRERSHDIVCVPAGDATEAREIPGVLVVDLSREPELGTYRGAPTRVGDDTVPASSWSTLVQLWAYTRYEADVSEVPPHTSGRAWSVAVPVIRERQLRQEAGAALLDLFSRDDVPSNLGSLLTPDTLTDFLPQILTSATDDSPGATVNRLDTLAKAGALGPDQTETVHTALRRAGFAERVLEDPRSLVGSGRRVEPSIRGLVRDLLAQDPHLTTSLASGEGVVPELSDWLGLQEVATGLISSLGSREPADFRSYDPEAPLVAAMVLGEIGAATLSETSSDGNPWGDASHSPVSRIADPEWSDAGDATGGSDDWGSLRHPASDPSPEAGPEQRERRLAIPGITVAFGLNSLPSLIDEPSEELTRKIRSADVFLRDDDVRLLTRGPWEHLFGEEVEWKEEPSGSDGPVTEFADVELRYVSDHELAAIARYPRLDWPSWWAREIWPGESEPDLLGRSVELLLRADAGWDSPLWRAQNAILAMGASSRLVDPAETLGLVLPWWRFDDMPQERVAEVARIATGIISHERPDLRPAPGPDDTRDVPGVMLEIWRLVAQEITAAPATPDPRDRRRRVHDQRIDRTTKRTTDRRQETRWE